MLKDCSEQEKRRSKKIARNVNAEQWKVAEVSIVSNSGGQCWRKRLYVHLVGFHPTFPSWFGGFSLWLGNHLPPSCTPSCLLLK